MLELKLQPEENFLLKCVQLEELLNVRHSVFVIGNAGTGKSQVLKALHKTFANMKRKPVWVDLNPKAVTNNELFGKQKIYSYTQNITQIMTDRMSGM